MDVDDRWPVPDAHGTDEQVGDGSHTLPRGVGAGADRDRRRRAAATEAGGLWVRDGVGGSPEKRPPPAPLRPRCRSRGAESSVVARGSGRIAMAADLLRQGGRHPGIAAVRWSSASPATADLSAPRDRHPPPQRFAAEHLFSMHPEGESLAAHNDRKETSTRTPSCLPGRLPIPIAGRARNEGLSTPWTVQRTTRRAFPRVARSARSLSARQRRGESRVARVKRRRLESRNRGSDEGRGPKTVFSNSKPREAIRPVLKDEFVPGEGHKEARLR
jgi:hypothetical protein